MKQIITMVSIVLVLASACLSIAAVQEDADEMEALKHTASVIRMLTEFDGAGSDFPSPTRERIESIISALRNDRVDEAEELFGSFLDDYKASGSTPETRDEELSDLFNAIMREAYTRDVADLRYVADKVRYYDEAILIAEKYIEELNGYRQEVGDGEIAITTTELKRRYAYAESPEALGSIRRLSAAGIDAEIERVKRRITDMEKQAESAVMQLQFSARRRMRVVDKIVAVHDRFHAVLQRHIEQAIEGKTSRDLEALETFQQSDA